MTGIFRMTGLFRRLLPTLRLQGETVTIQAATLLDYKPGKRGLIRYEMAGGTLTVYGKLYAEPGQVTRVYQHMKLLWEEVFSGHAQFSLPHPIGCIPELFMLVYIPAAGDVLTEMLAGDQALSLTALAGAWLGTLHRSRLSLSKQFHLENELRNVRAWAALVGSHYPDQAGAATRIATYLQERAGAMPFEIDVPIHKDFHHGHVIVNHKLHVIDFDEMRLGDPNFDLAHFCANLYLLACRQDHANWPFPAFRRAFLDAYAGSTRWVADERLDYFFAYSCLKIAWQLSNGYGPHPRPEGDERHRQVRQMLQQGVELASPAWVIPSNENSLPAAGVGNRGGQP
jgi:streptomycin 6-kinase